MDKIIKLETFNPFSHLYPDLKIISRDTLNLVKLLRREGFEIIFIPEDNRKVNYLFRKGVHEFFADPFIAYCMSIPTAILTGIITNAISKLLEKKNNSQQIINNNIIINNGSHNVNIAGEIIAETELEKIIDGFNDKQNKYKECFQTPSLNKKLPIPIFLEHEPRIVGWGSITHNDKGIMVDNAEIFDKETGDLFEKKVLNGFSIYGIALKSVCSICGDDYVYCKHTSGEDYQGVNCTNRIEKSIPLEISIVRTPINNQCKIKIIK